MLLYLFFDCVLFTCPKKWKLKNGPGLPTLPHGSLMYLTTFFFTNEYETRVGSSFTDIENAP